MTDCSNDLQLVERRNDAVNHNNYVTSSVSSYDLWYPKIHGQTKGGGVAPSPPPEYATASMRFVCCNCVYLSGCIYDGPLLCGFNVAIKGLKDTVALYLFVDVNDDRLATAAAAAAALVAVVTLVNLPCLATQSREMNPLFNGCFITMQLRRKAAVMPLCRLVSETFARGRVHLYLYVWLALYICRRSPRDRSSVDHQRRIMMNGSAAGQITAPD